MNLNFSAKSFFYKAAAVCMIALLALTALPALPARAAAAVSSNGSGGGTWATATTWSNNTPRTNTINTTTGSQLVTGVGTAFTTELSVGNIIKNTSNVAIGTILSIANDTALNLTAPASSTTSGIGFHSQGAGPSDDVTILSGDTVTAAVALGTPTILTGAIIVDGTLSIPAGMTSSGPLTINNGGALSIITAGSTSTGALTINSGGVLSTTRPLTVNGAANITGTINFDAAGAHVFNGNVTLENLAVWDSTGFNITPGFKGDFTNNGATTFITGSGAYTFNGTTAQAIGGSAVTSFGSITINNPAATVSANTNFNVSGTMVVTTTFSPGAAVVINSGAAAGTINGAGTIQVTRIAATADYVNQYKFTINTLTSLTVEYAGAGAQTINSTVGAYGALTTSGSGTKTLAGAVTVSGAGKGTVTIGSGTTLDTSVTNYAISLTGNWTNNGGTFIPNSGTVTFTSTAAQIGGTATSQTFYNVIINKTAGQLLSVGGSTTTLTVNDLTETLGNFTAPATLNVNGTVTLTTGTFTAGTNVNVAVNWTRAAGTVFTPGSGTVTFNGPGTQTINGSFVSQTFYDVIIAKTVGQPLNLGGSTTTLIVNNLTQTTGNFNPPATLTVNGNVTLTDGTLTAGANTNVGGNWTNDGSAFLPGVNTITFNGTGAQTIGGAAAPHTFYNMVVNKASGTLGNSGALTVNNLTQTAGAFTTSAALNVNGNVILTAGTFTTGANTNVAGNWTNNGATFAGSNTVTFNGASAQTINGSAASQTFHNVVVAKTGGQLLNTGGGTTTLTVNNLTQTSGNFTAPATLNINGDFTLTTGTFTAGANINAAGDWTKNGGTFTPGVNTVTFNGASLQDIGGSTNSTFNNLTLNNASGATLANSAVNITVNAALTLTSGVLTTGSNKVILPTTATISNAGAATYINGNVQRAFTGASPSFTFPIGDASLHSPLDLTFTGISTGGDVTASVTGADCAAIVTAGIDSSKSVNHCWTLTNSGVLFTSYDATFNYANGVVDASIPAAFIAKKYTLSAWSGLTLSGTPTITSTTVTGATSMSDFAIGEPDITAPTVLSVNSTAASGTYTTSNIIPVTVTFSEPVIVTGFPTLTLSTGSPATTAVNYSSGTGTATLTFNYTVSAGNTSANLDYAATNSLALNSGTIKDTINDATLTLAAPGAAGSLGANKLIIIDTAPPTVTFDLQADSDTGNSSTDNLTVAPILVFDAIFNEAVSGFANGDLSNVGSASGCAFAVGAPTGNTYPVTVSACTIGTVIVRMAASGVTDTMGNAIAQTDGPTVTKDPIPPVYIVRKAGSNNPTDEDLIEFTVTFGNSVTGVDKNDFKLTNTGVIDTSIASVTPVSASVYTVAVNTGSRNGTIRLDIRYTETITSYTGAYTDGQTYNIEKGSPPTVPLLTSPATGAIVTSYTPTLDWGNSTQIMALNIPGWHYKINVTAPGYDQTFSTQDNPLPLTGLAVSQYTFDINAPLTANTTFTWKVRSCNDHNECSAWSLSRTFSTKLATPELNLPADDPTSVSPLNNVRPTFEWDQIPGATSYTLQILKGTTVVVTGTITAPAYVYTPTANLLFNTVYTWKVKANGKYTGDYSAPFTFKTSLVAPPVPPTLSAPLSAVLVLPSAQTLDWNPVLMAATTPAALSFEVNYATNSAFSGASNTIVPVNFNNLDPIASTLYVTPALLPGRTYYWRVRSWSAANATGDRSAWSLVRTINVKFVEPTPLSPADLATGISRTAPTFTWSSGNNGLWTNYTIQLAIVPPTATTFTAVKTFTAIAPNQTYTAALTASTQLLANQKYYWRVRINGLYTPIYSIPTGVSSWSFTTTTP